MFTKQHVVKIADRIRNAKAAHPEAQEPLDTLQVQLAAMFADDGSPGFTLSDFETQCRPSSPLENRHTA